MKKVTLTLAILACVCFSMPAYAQINVSIQPTWGPQGYNYVNYYYMPDIETYYCVPTRQFTWFNGNRWVTTYDLPPRYAGYDLYGAYKVVLNERNPWFRHNIYRDRYYGYRGRHQELIFESHDPRYFERRREGGYYGERRREEIRREEHRDEVRREEHRDAERRGEVRREEHRDAVRREEHRDAERRGEERREEHRNAERREEHRQPEHRNEVRREEHRQPEQHHQAAPRRETAPRSNDRRK